MLIQVVLMIRMIRWEIVESLRLVNEILVEALHFHLILFFTRSPASTLGVDLWEPKGWRGARLCWFSRVGSGGVDGERRWPGPLSLNTGLPSSPGASESRDGKQNPQSLGPQPQRSESR